jgi:Uma2 family endonuclease
MTSTPVLIPVEEYLRTVYRPDRDYVDGEVKERNLGEKSHSKIQAFLIGYFLAHASEWKIDPLPEQRVQVSADRYRVPDITLIAEGGPEESIIRTPPVLCIEILSREDRMTEILGRVDDYLEMGVPAVWIVDPCRSLASRGVPGGQ